MKKKVKMGIMIAVSIVVVAGLYYYFFLGPTLAFQKQEKQLLEAGQLYFEQNSYLLPKKGDIKEITLSTLYDQKYVDTFYIPNSKKICSSDKSFVKAKNTDGEITYLAYLSCGKYHSTTDNQGPEIILNGEDEITIARGSTYQEKGIKTVKDNEDGKMDNKDVTIDASKVDTENIGTYTVTYTAYDSLKNKTVKKRTVKVVQMLSDTVQEDTNQKGYYQGTVENNYLMFNAILWRIVGVEEDGSVTIVTDEPLANVDYTLAKNTNIKNSSMDQWLNGYFYSLLSKDAKNMIVKNSEWCSDSLTSEQLTTTTCEKKIKMNVGLISIQDYNKSLDGRASYLDSYNIVTWMLNPSKKGEVWTQRDNYINDEGVYYKSYSDDILFGVRPAIRLKGNLEIVEGDGSSTDPYSLGDYQAGKQRDLLNTRLTGEYVNYSGYLFRIIDINDETTHVISNDVLTQDGNPIYIKYQDNGTTSIYNPDKKGNLGYQITNDMTQYIQTSYFAKKKITVPIYKDRAMYKKETDTKEYTVKMAAPNTFDLFSAKSESSFYGYWYINSSKNSIRKYVASAMGTIYYTDTIEDSYAGARISAYFDKNVKIKSGKGTRENPYIITK